MESIKLLGAKEFSVGGVNLTLTLTQRVLLTMFVCKWLKGELPVRISQKEIAEDLGIEYRTVSRLIKDLIGSELLLARKSKDRGTGYIGWNYYGHKEITVDGFVIPENFIEFADDEIHLVNQPNTVKDYYVYVCTHKNVPVYVGKGTGLRMDHCLSGKSTSFGLNKLVIEGEIPNMKVTKMYSGLTSEQAMIKEREIIDGFRLLGYDLANVQ